MLRPLKARRTAAQPPRGVRPVLNVRRWPRWGDGAGRSPQNAGKTATAITREQNEKNSLKPICDVVRVAFIPTNTQLAAFFDDAYVQTGEYPTVFEAASDFGVSKRTVQRAVAQAGIELPTGRRKGDTP